MSKPTICLNMIVKDEVSVIRRCLDSVRPLIDCWLIVDTGSSDGTQDVVRELLKDLPGELVERPWVDFAHNRSEALDLARGRADYLLFIDADEVLDPAPGFAMGPLTADVYSVLVQYSGCSYTRRLLVRDGKPWRYEGVVHEYVTCPEPFSEAPLLGLVLVPRHDGARARDPLTYRRDALALEQALLKEPDNARYVFYLAQSYRDAGDFELALRHYTRRAGMQGWPEEAWFSLYQIAQIKERLKAPWPEVLEAYLAAYQAAADRAGPLFRIAMHYQGKQDYRLSHLFLSRCMVIPPPSPARLFVERPLYDHQIAVEYAVASHYIGDYKTAIATNNVLLRGAKVPPQLVDLVIRNRRYSVDALTPKCESTVEPGPLRVVVVVRDPGPDLDDCVDSLLQQDFADWQALFVDDGSARDPRHRLPLDDPRISFVRHDTARAVDACLDDALRDAGDDAVVLPLSPSERLADRAALTQLRAPFADPGCLLAYGQFRTPTGALGNAEPASGEDDFAARRAGLAGGAAVAFRRAAWGGSRESVWARAGFPGTRFLDAAITVRGIAAPRIRIADATVPAPAVPKISCLMVTLDRLSLAKRAIQSYADQSYPNRELVIVTDGAPRFREALERHVTAAGIDGVRFVYPEGRRALGALRNISLAEARGEIVCQWDDDDCSHPDRLRVQCDDMLRRGARASFMSDHLHLLSGRRMLCWVDWTLGGPDASARLFPGTLMMFNDPRFRYPESGPYARQGEDSALLAKIVAAVPVAQLSGAGYLYLYAYHGRNTFSEQHHLHVASFRMASSVLQANAEALREAVAYYPVERPVVIVGKEGPVFALS